MTQNSWVGKTLSDRYQIDELLGQGGMSAVYKAADPNLRRVVAVKMIHAHLSADKEFVRRFEEEATSVAQLRHPNIVQVFDFNQDDGTYYMVLEFVPGETLQDRLRRLNAEGRRMPYAEAAKYTINVCEAADYAHKRGMIHRDIKPANIMLDIHGQGILMDFGIAKIIGGEQHTATGAVIGTALYMAPEQIRGEKIDERVDVYATGVTLFEMLNGKPPYEADSAMTLMMKHLNDPIPNLRDLQPDAPGDLIAVVEKALAKDRADRYQNQAEMAADLQAVVDRIQAGAPVGAAVVQTVAAGAAAGATVAAVASADSGEPAVAATVPVSGDPSAGGAAAETAAAPVSPPPGESQAGGAAKKPNFALIGGGVALVLVLLCAVVGGVFAFGQFSGDDKAYITETADALALIIAAMDTETPAPIDTVTPLPPTATPEPEQSPTPALSPTPTIPEGVPYVRINDVSLDSEGYYVVEYETFGFTDQLLLDGYHITFFMDDIPPDQVGHPYETNYYMYAGPSPFEKFNQTVRQETAEQMCVLVTRPDHTVVQESGTCYPLPEAGVDAGIQTSGGLSNSPTSAPTGYPTATKEKTGKY